jgi:ubiquitin-conjugating enzyme E2 S
VRPFIHVGDASCQYRCSGWFATKIFHPNVSSAGEICVNTLKKDWQSSYGIGHILVTVKCLLIYPNPESALDEEAGKLLLEDYESYCGRAKLITNVHATPRTKPVEFNESPDAESSSSAAPSEPSPVPLRPSTSKTPPPTSTQLSVASPVIANTSSASAAPLVPPSRLTVPVSTHKSTSPAPQPYPRKMPHTSEKEGKDKDRHPSPSPLAIADANVGVHKPVTGLGVSLASNAMPTGTTKTMKRAATGSAATNAEKRKKALKRL